MPLVQNARKLEKVLDLVYGTPHVITQAKLDQVCDLLDRRLAGPPTSAELAAFEEPAPDQESLYQVTPGGVAILGLDGIISQRMNLFGRISGGTSTELFGQMLQKALADPAVKAVLLNVNSPGGSYGGTTELADAVFAARLGSKPIAAIANTQMDSGAYWIGSAASRVFASPSSTLGSIGVYIVHQEFAKSDEKMGRRRTMVKAGRWKAMGNDIEPLDAETRVKLQERVDAIHDLFLEAVARNRGVSADRVRATFGQGESLLARDAVAAGLADRIATLPEVVAELESLARQSPIPKPQSLSNRTKGALTMDPKIRAALVARGLIAADASEETAKAVLNTFYAIRGETVPDDAAISLKDLIGALPKEPEKKIEPLRRNESPTADEVADQVMARMAADEKFRVETIRAECELVGLDEAQSASLVNLRLPAAETRDKIRELLVGAGEPVPRITFGAAELDKFAALAQEAIDARCMASASVPEEKAAGWTDATAKVRPEAREFLGMRLLDLAARCLQVEGVRTRGMSPRQIASLALAKGGQIMLAGEGPAYYGSGAFANLALNAAHKVLVRGFNEAPVTWRLWCRQGESVADFKIQNLIKASAASDLEVKPEGRETPEDTGLTDDREYFQVETYAKKASFSREMLINDDLGALSRIPRAQGIAAARTFNKLAWKIVTGNPTMADGIALFHASSHGGNLLGTGTTTAAPPSVATLQLMQAVLRKQKDLNSDATLNTPVRWILVPVALEATANTLLRSQTDPASTNANVPNYFYGQVQPVVEPLLDATSAAQWYAAADAALMDTILVCFLQGEETPVLESWWDPDRGARIQKVQQTGAAVLAEFRGLAKHVGFSA